MLTSSRLCRRCSPSSKPVGDLEIMNQNLKFGININTQLNYYILRTSGCPPSFKSGSVLRPPDQLGLFQTNKCPPTSLTENVLRGSFLHPQDLSMSSILQPVEASSVLQTNWVHPLSEVSSNLLTSVCVLHGCFLSSRLAVILQSVDY